jgi:hypothetical protein
MTIVATAVDDVRLANAAKNRDIATVRTLLKQKADPNAADVDGTARRSSGPLTTAMWKLKTPDSPPAQM